MIAETWRKFTPLGFETMLHRLATQRFLLRKFTPLGFETPLKTRKLFTKPRRKFTPLGFETKQIAYLCRPILYA